MTWYVIFNIIQFLLVLFAFVEGYQRGYAKGASQVADSIRKLKEQNVVKS